jgi:hypothetical protein
MNGELTKWASSFAKARADAEQNLDFDRFVTDHYRLDSVYTASYGGVLEVSAEGQAEILSTHYGRDMALGWNGWSWPCRDIYVAEKRRALLHWVNLAPGRRADGSRYETPGVSFLEFDETGRIIKQDDMMDLAAQLRLCDELDEAGLLADALRDSWVVPMKEMLVKGLS